MKVYVDELPENCEDCKLGWFYDCQYCILRQDLMEQDIWCEKEKHCPLQSLTDYTKQVCEKIREWAAEHTLDFWTCENDDLDAELYEFLDQIEKGE